MRRPDLLRLFVWGFLLWWFLPVVLVVRESLSSADAPFVSGWSLMWYEALPAQLLAHVTLALPYVVAIVWIRLVTLEPGLEEMAMDLGARETSVLARVLLPLAGPALALAALVAAIVSFENLVLSEWLCVQPSCRTVPMLLYRGGAGPPPMRSALATAASALSLTLGTAVFVGVVAVSRRRRRTV